MIIWDKRYITSPQKACNRKSSILIQFYGLHISFNKFAIVHHHPADIKSDAFEI